jgi:hypothetical protein
MMKLGVARRFVSGPVLALVALIAFAAVGAPSAFGEASKVFDPTLSLTGSCAESSLSPLDEVLDPGCPSKHPPEAFADPRGVAIDFYGDIYVASIGKTESGTEGRVDIFGPDGVFISELPYSGGPRNLAVDSQGTLYVMKKSSAGSTANRLLRFEPTVYSPATHEIEYEDLPGVIEPEPRASEPAAIAVNPSNDHLFANFGGGLVEYGSAAEGNPVIEKQSPCCIDGSALAIDAKRGLIYKSELSRPIEILDLASPHEPVGTIDGSTLPAGSFSGEVSVAVDEDTGHLFVLDDGASKLYELSASGEYIGTIEHGFQASVAPDVAVDNGPFSPNGGLNPDGRYVFVASHPKGIGHLFAFRTEPPPCLPVVESVAAANVDEGEAELRGIVNPCNLPTQYTFEYTPQAQFEAEGFANASVAGTGQLPATADSLARSAFARGLEPNTAYRFRLVASNGEGDSSGEGTFTTYPANPLSPCPNDAFRRGPAALLPDCRGYELVTPGYTNGRAPRGLGGIGAFFTMPQVSPQGDKVSFLVEGGAIPGTGGTGAGIAFGGDPYRAVRQPDGWQTTFIGPTGEEAVQAEAGGTSPDQGYSFFGSGGSGGTLGTRNKFLRYPDGHFEPIGRGSLKTDPDALGLLISEGASHVIFTPDASAGEDVRLEPNAPASPTKTIYDRTTDGVTHVVSLLPGDVTPKPGENAIYETASFDGRGVAFAIGGTLYLRYDNAETFEIGEGLTVAGVAEGGSRVFYLDGGKLWRFDAQNGQRASFNSSGTVVPVNVSADGSTAYFVSTSVLTTRPNPSGSKAHAGSQNLYRSREGAISFIGTVTERDVLGEHPIVGGKESVEAWDGLGLWTTALGSGSGRGKDPSRTTSDGNVFLFESRAPLTGYDSGGKDEIYRYDSPAQELTCLSCDPSGSAATGDASLESNAGEGGLAVVTDFALIANLSENGRRAFFQSPDPLVASDDDRLQDVYEWEAPGVGSCVDVDGCIYLISSGQSARADYLYAASPSGEDVFFLTGDQLLGTDLEETASIYDARVGGGFAETAVADCEGEGCRPALAPQPALPVAHSPVRADGHTTVRRCPKGKRKARRHHAVRCVKKGHKHHRRHRRAGTKRGASR